MRSLLRLLSALILALALLPALASAQVRSAPVTSEVTPGGKIRLSYLFSDGNIPGTIAAFNTLMAERPDLRGKVELFMVTESTFADTTAAEVKGSRILVYDVMNEQLMGRFDAEKKASLIRDVNAHGLVLGVGQGLQAEDAYAKQGVTWDKLARAYWEHSGPQNQLALMKLALTRAGVKGFTLPEPQPSIDFGYYYPGADGGRVFAKWEEFDAWRIANGKKHQGRAQVAIGFFKAIYYSGDTQLLDALIAEVEKQGADAVPIFGYPGAVAFEGLLKGPDGKPRADVGMALNMQFVDTDAPKLMEKLGIPVLNLISLYGRTEKEWQDSKGGLSSFEGTFNLAAPELAGTTAPTVVGTKEKFTDKATGLTSVITAPIQERVTMAVSRSLKYAALGRKPNADKHIALIYYNYPPGKANIGASYLNVADSLANILARLKAEGYDIGDHVPTSDEVLAAITTKARNVGGDAPGELGEMLAAGDAMRVPMKDYRAWLNALPASLRTKMIKDWGEPEKSGLMATRDAGVSSFVIPGVKYGNIVLMPQPQRGWGEDLEKMFHAKDLAPHHQYLAAYAWLRNSFHADAVVHIGTHGTLEWLDGRDVGLGPDDAPDALIADLPDAYIYNVDVVGEGLVARRRGMATLVDHMVPPFKPGGLTEELAKLSELMNDHSLNETKNPELAETYGKQVQAEAIRMGIAKDLGLDPARTWTDEELHRIENYLLDLKKQIIPYGLHAFGRTPEQEAIDSTVLAVTSVDRSKLPDGRKILAVDMEQRIKASGPRELDSLMLLLSGKFVPAGLGGEPVRNPDAYATGANFYGIDPDKIPKPAAWDMGAKLAEQMLQDYKAKYGRYPSKVSFVIWGDETMRHEGVLESQIFYLLGAKPIWNERGKVVGVEIIPREKLGRPRVDIVIASAAEGMFANLTRLMDEAVQKVKALDEADNQVRQHYLATKAALIKQGVKEADADKMAGVRIFDEPPGIFNLNTSTIVATSGAWDSDAGFANDYIRKMGHGYGNGYWGEAMPEVFRLAISGTDTVVHSNSTSLYGVLDNDDMFMYMGGLASAVRSIDGTSPETLITDTRDPGNPQMATLDKFIGQEFRSRYVNPTWIKGMQKEGYAGAGAMREFIEYMWGWDATVTTAVDDKMWKETFDTYVEDKHNLGMKAWFEAKSPYAYQDITARMIETVRKGYWNADQATRTKLLNEYIESVNKHGVNCTAVSCGNARLLDYALKEAAKAGVPAPKIAQAKAALEKAMGRKIEDAARQLEAFAKSNDARENAERAKAQASAAAMRNQAQAAPAQSAPGKQPSKPVAAQPLTEQVKKAAQQLKGMLMTEEERSQKLPDQNKPQPRAIIRPLDMLWPALLLLALLIGWRWRDRAYARA